MRSETYRGEGILYDFNVFFNEYVHELVTNDTDLGNNLELKWPLIKAKLMIYLNTIKLKTL